MGVEDKEHEGPGCPIRRARATREGDDESALLLLAPAVFLVLHQGFEIAVQAQSVVAADGLAAFRAAPLFLFLFEEALDAVIPDEFKVFDHAHVVPGAVALIQVFQAAAGELGALVAKPHPSLAQQGALPFHEGAVLAARQAAGAVLLAEPLLLQVVLHRQVTDAERAVHAAGSDQLFFHQVNSVTQKPLWMVKSSIRAEAQLFANKARIRSNATTATSNIDAARAPRVRYQASVPFSDFIPTRPMTNRITIHGMVMIGNLSPMKAHRAKTTTAMMM